MHTCKLRKATLNDCNFLFQLVNDSLVRKNSFHTEVINIDEHTNWLKKKLQEKSSDIYIYMFDEQPIGQVRVDYANMKSGYIDYSIVEKFRGQGYGNSIISLVEKEYIGRLLELIAEVKKENIASQLVFKKNGYDEIIGKDINKYIKKI